MADARPALPSVDSLLNQPPATRASERFGRPVVARALRSVLDAARARAARGTAPPSEEVILARAVGLAARMALGLSAAVNATGVVLHTNLGRSPLPEEALRAVVRTGRGYADLEMDRVTGRRSHRSARAEFLLCALTGAEDALVVNNNAAAILLVLTALARRKEVPVSRGELIEIGGEFRLPEIMAASGARLVEVGTTNRTRLSDYEAVLSEKTALILKVHPSNFRVMGFAETTPLGRLSELARKAEVPLVHDVGSGLLTSGEGVPGEEPAVADSLAQGADLVTFSGDKLLGGPQAGLIVGRADLMARLRRHPINRAVRVDKMTLAALEVVLRLHATGRRSSLPPWESIDVAQETLRGRAEALAGSVAGAEVVDAEAVVGGGSVPGYGLPSVAVRLKAAKPERLAARLRAGNPPVFCRVEDDALLFDLRTVPPGDDPRLARAISYTLSQERA